MLLLVLAQLAAGSLAFAAEAVPTETDRVQQKRAVELSEHLRCLVCQNQTIADSNAELAQDLVQRYGDFVRYTPPVKATTLLLWFGPALLLLAGIVVLFRNLRARALLAGPSELSGEERARAASLLDGGIGKDRT